MKRLHLTVEEEVVVAIDAARGDVPRSVWIQRAVEKALGPSSERSAPEAVETTGRRDSSRPAPSRPSRFDKPFNPMPKEG